MQLDQMQCTYYVNKVSYCIRTVGVKKMNSSESRYTKRDNGTCYCLHKYPQTRFP